MLHLSDYCAQDHFVVNFEPRIPYYVLEGDDFLQFYAGQSVILTMGLLSANQEGVRT